MSDSDKDKAYADGVKAGKESDLMGDFAESLSHALPKALDGPHQETHDEGYAYGRDHRHDRDSDDSDE